MGVTELWAERELRHDRYGYSAVRAFDVLHADSEVDAVAQVGISEGDHHDYAGFLRALKPFGAPTRPGSTRWRVRVVYREPPPPISAVATAARTRREA